MSFQIRPSAETGLTKIASEFGTFHMDPIIVVPQFASGGKFLVALAALKSSVLMDRPDVASQRLLPFEGHGAMGPRDRDVLVHGPYMFLSGGLFGKCLGANVAGEWPP